ncbi:DNA helicase mcm9 [Cymbomonas tetramitiformis]|uniref:DNA helicase n=1 Tax=Cymbomonas tetramitiformis TaxID=36881 RepID=A0AAE0C737_9CHLO|nr:DNA helicase mcm9 [Cymbomonas tetramitiformis]
MSEFDPHAYVAALTKYLLSHQFREIERLLGKEENDDRPHHFPIHINFTDLHSKQPELANQLLSTPRPALTCFDRAILQSQEIFMKSRKASQPKLIFKRLVHARVDLHRLPFSELSPTIGQLRCVHVGKLLHISGTIIRTGLVKMAEAGREYTCAKCKHRFFVAADLLQGGDFHLPSDCPSTAQGSLCPGVSFRPVPESNVFHDYQELKVQESAHALQVGSVPRSVTVLVEDDLVDLCQAGDSVCITGILEPRWRPFRPEVFIEVEHVLRANRIHVKSDAQKLSGTVELSSELRSEFEAFWAANSAQPIRARNHILSSICPQIYGLGLVKLAVALMLIGGVSRTDPQGTRTRGQVHLLLVGDPGTGKSQFMRYATKLANRAVVTTGRGSSSAGLTAAAVKDNGEWTLEAGALVLADGGICCIDEFDGISDGDRAVILEAMEQQTISVAKAGLVTTLHTRTSVLGIMNPKGTFDRTASLAVNTSLSGPLLSRFDMILVMLDTKDAAWDQVVSSHILDSHSGGGDPVRDSAARGAAVSGAVGPLWDIDKLRAYVQLVKETFEPSLTSDAEQLLSAYYTLQRRSAGYANARTTIRLLESLVRMTQAHARLMFRPQATRADAATAVIIMEASSTSSPILGAMNAMDAFFGDEADQDFHKQEQLILQQLSGVRDEIRY